MAMEGYQQIRKIVESFKWSCTKNEGEWGNGVCLLVKLSKSTTGMGGKVARTYGQRLPKSLDSDEALTYAILEVGQKSAFWVKNSVSWARSTLLHGIYCIFH